MAVWYCALLARELHRLSRVDTGLYLNDDNQRELKVLKRAEAGRWRSVSSLLMTVDTGGTAVAIREMYPKRTLSPSSQKNRLRPLVDDYVVDIPQDTGLNSRGYGRRIVPLISGRDLFNARYCRALFFLTSGGYNSFQ